MCLRCTQDFVFEGSWIGIWGVLEDIVDLPPYLLIVTLLNLLELRECLVKSEDQNE